MIPADTIVRTLRKEKRIMSAEMKPPSVLKKVAELNDMDLSQLKDRWRELFDSEPPSYGRTMMTKRLAYRIQELAYGGLPGEVRDEVNRILHSAGYDDIGRKGHVKKQSGPVPGTLLIREWKDGRHEVSALENGFEYRGRRFRSLSAVAFHITGTKWNGPAFFGLRDNGGGK